LGYTPVSAAQINGNRAWPNIPAVVPLHGSNSNGESNPDYQGIGERIPGNITGDTLKVTPKKGTF